MKYTWHFKIYFFYDDGIAENLLLIEQGNPQNSEQQKAQEDAKRSVSEILLCIITQQRASSGFRKLDLK
jgi:hypothetical protein